ncbi:hypothetical protein [Kitasatospora cystarginea]
MSCPESITLTEQQVDDLEVNGLVEDDEYGCDLTTGHEGRHLVFAGDIAADSDMMWWLRWEGAEFSVEKAPCCGDCGFPLLPADHADGEGCRAPKEPRCASSVNLSETEVATLNGLEAAGCEVEEKATCDLSPSHDGRHSAFVQDQNDELLWWVAWDEAGDHVIMIADGCSELIGEDPCMLMGGHGGDHRP